MQVLIGNLSNMFKKCKIVMYHYIRNIKNSNYPNLKGLEVELFEKQIKHFKKNFSIVEAEQILDCIYNNSQLPSNAMILTFDDGFKEHYSNVYPILKKNDVPGLFFPPAKPICEKSVLDVHKIHFILAKNKNSNEIIKQIFELINHYKNEYSLDSPENYYSKLCKPNRFDTGEIIFIKRILQRELPETVRCIILDNLFQNYVHNDEELFSSQLYLSKDEIKEMMENNLFFGSHTYSHYWLTHLTENELDNELNKSVKFYEEILANKKTWMMCYPYGNYNESVIKKLKNLGFKAGLTTKVGEAELDESKAFKLSRYDTNDFQQ